MTWNVWGRFGPWEKRQPAIVMTLRAEAPDVVCLQESYAVPGDDQPARIATALGGFHVARAAIWAKDDRWMGNAVVSRWPILEATTHVLPSATGAPSHRSALVTRIDAPFGAITVITTHLDHRFDGSATRQAQVGEICRIASGIRDADPGGYPVLLVGDLNAVPDSDEIRSLTGRRPPPAPGLVFTDAWEVAGDGSAGATWCDSNPYNADSFWPRRRIDYLLVSWPRPSSKGKPVRCRVVPGAPADDGTWPSDHSALVTDLRRS